MKHNFLKLSFAIFMAVNLILSGCSEDEETKPSAPQLSSEMSTLPIKFGDTQAFTVTVSAAGKFKEITATADKGTVEVKDVTGVGQATGSAKVHYTAPFEAGAAKISIVAKDEAGQQITMDVSVDITEQPPVMLTGGEVEGVWGPSRTYYVSGNLLVPQGKSLTIKEGVTIIIDGDGTQEKSPEINVAGNIYSYGTAEKPVVFTVPQDKRKKENMFAGLWGGVLAMASSQEMVIEYTTIEFAGAPAAAGSPIVNSGEMEEGDPRYGLYFNNPSGKVVLKNSTFAYTKDDGVRINQGQLLVMNNMFIYNGKTGGEALNIKSGAVGDVAYNVFFQAATNGVKWSNSDDRSPQNDVNVYNNTAVNCGWRQTKSGRGGSFNLEKGGRGQVYNNMVVNCRYGVRFSKSPDNPDLENSKTGYNFYFGNNATIVEGFYPSVGSISKGDYETAHDVSGAVNENDPKFENFNVTTFDMDNAKNADNLEMPGAMSLKLKSDSPALNKGKTGFSTKFTTHSIGGKSYAVPAPANFIGAMGN